MVHECDLGFGGLAVVGSDAFAEGFEAGHLRFDAAAGVNGGEKMYQRGGVKMYQSPGLSLSP